MSQTKAQLLGPVLGDVNYDSGTLVVDSVNNVVGIGTTTSTGAGAKLVVGGRIQSNDGGYWFGGANGAEDGWHVQESSGNLLVTESGVAERVRISSTGNVGIGTDNPLNTLHVSTSAGGTSARFTDATNSTVFISHPSAGKSKIADSGGNYGFEFDTASVNILAGGSEKVRISSTGNVGIGTTNPDTTLHIEREVAQNDNVGILQVESRNENTGSATNASIIVKNKYGYSQLMQWESNGLRLGVRSVANGGTGDLILTAGADGEKLRITSTGNVGIGTTNPTTKLELQSSYASQATNHFATFARTGGAINAVIGYNAVNIDYMYMGTGTAHPFGLRTNNTLALYIDTNQNVGIGVTNPSQKLVVDGVVTATNFISSSYSVLGSIVAADPGANYYSWNNRIGGGLAVAGTTYLDGNVGIGTTNPTQKLHVEGNITLNPTTNHRGLICSTTNFKYYTGLSGSSGQWFTIGTAGDTMTKKYKVVAYAHTMAEFIVQQAFNDERITLLMAHRAINGYYATMDGIRVTTDSLVQIQLNWSAGPYVGVGVYVESFGIDPAIPWLPDSLVAETKTAYDTVYTSSYSARFYSNLRVEGSLSKGSGSFQIDHPLESKKDTHYLVHSFTESPQADLIYRGTIELVDGSASVNIDTEVGMTEGTFEVLCRNVQCFTTNETGWSAVKGTVVGNILNISCQDSTSTDTISWMIVGERQDPHIMECQMTDENGYVIIEPMKPQ